MIGYQTKNVPINASIKDVDGKKGIITGYFAHFNTLDSDGDIIAPGAFTKTIKETGPQSVQPRIKHLRNHAINEPIGVLQVLKEDTKGLYYQSQPGTHFIGQDTIKMIESGIITEHSFGFETIRKDQKSDARHLLELAMWEGSSLTAWGANERTGGAMMKSLGKDAYIKMLSDRSNAVAKFCRNTNATDETIELLLLECKQLTQIILDLSIKSTEPDKCPDCGKAMTNGVCQDCNKSTLPESEVKSAMAEFIKSL